MRFLATLAQYRAATVWWWFPPCVEVSPAGCEPCNCLPHHILGSAHQLRHLPTYVLEEERKMVDLESKVLDVITSVRSTIWALIVLWTLFFSVTCRSKETLSFNEFNWQVSMSSTDKFQWVQLTSFNESSTVIGVPSKGANIVERDCHLTTSSRYVHQRSGVKTVCYTAGCPSWVLGEFANYLWRYPGQDILLSHHTQSYGFTLQLISQWGKMLTYQIQEAKSNWPSKPKVPSSNFTTLWL